MRAEKPDRKNSVKISGRLRDAVAPPGAAPMTGLSDTPAVAKVAGEVRADEAKVISDSGLFLHAWRATKYTPAQINVMPANLDQPNGSS